jgi:hypothetical protein
MPTDGSTMVVFAALQATQKGSPSCSLYCFIGLLVRKRKEKREKRKEKREKRKEKREKRKEKREKRRKSEEKEWKIPCHATLHHNCCNKSAQGGKCVLRH